MSKKKTGETDVIKEVEQKTNTEKRDALIQELKGKLLSKSDMKKGGASIRSQHSREAGYQAVIDEINLLGKELGIAPVGLGSLRG